MVLFKRYLRVSTPVLYMAVRELRLSEQETGVFSFVNDYVEWLLIGLQN